MPGIVRTCEWSLLTAFQPRHWLRNVIGQGGKQIEADSIVKYGHVSNHIAEWYVIRSAHCDRMLIPLSQGNVPCSLSRQTEDQITFHASLHRHRWTASADE